MAFLLRLTALWVDLSYTTSRDTIWPAPPKVSKRSLPLPSGPTSSGWFAALTLRASLRLLLRFATFPRSIIAPGARREGPSLAHRGSRGIHAAQPLTQRFHSAFWGGVWRRLRDWYSKSTKEPEHRGNAAMLSGCT